MAVAGVEEEVGAGALFGVGQLPGQQGGERRPGHPGTGEHPGTLHLRVGGDHEDAIELALRALFSPDAERTPATITDVVSGALAFAGASTLAALGLFQILAWRFAADARRINLHSRPVETDRHSSDVDWSTRES